MMVTTIVRPDWISSVPSGWVLLPIRAVLKERSEKNNKLEFDNILSVMKGVGVIRYEDKGNVGNKSSDRPEAYKIVRRNDIVLNSMNLSIGSLGIAREDGVTSSVYIIYKAREGVANADFFHYLFQAIPFQKYLASFGRGIMQLREAVKEIDIRNQVVAVPPFETQKRIAAFLAKKTKIIDELVAKKERLIELLREERTAIINQAVTKGLDPKVEMKDSGIKWLGMIPKHWKIKRLKYVGEVIIGLTYSPDEVSSAGTLVLRASNIQDGKIVLEDNVYVNKQIPEKLIVKDNDILICSRSGSRSLIGKCAYIKEHAGNSFGTFMTVFRSKSNRFVYHVLNSTIFAFHIGSFLTSTINQLTTENLNGIIIAIPPFEDQIVIAEFLERKTAEIDEQVEREQKSIELLKEYRSSLIYSSVTGKIEI